MKRDYESLEKQAIARIRGTYPGLWEYLAKELIKRERDTLEQWRADVEFFRGDKWEESDVLRMRSLRKDSQNTGE